MIYLDNAATSWPKPEMVYQAVDNCLRSGGSPGRGTYASAQRAVGILDQTREALASLLGVSNPLQLVFASSATDAVNTALFGAIKQGDRIVTTTIEHNATARPLRYLSGIGIDIIKIPVNAAGQLDLLLLERAVKTGVQAVVINHASNVSGAVMPLAEIGEIAKRHQALFIVDAAQTAGIELIDAAQMHIDLLAFSGHKGLFGPQGTGGLYIKENVTVRPTRYGGTGSLSESDRQPGFLPDCLESGTPNMPGIAGLLAGVRFIAATGREVIKKRETVLSAELIAGLKEIKQVQIYGPADPARRTAVVSFVVAGQDSRLVAVRLDKEFGIACRAGLHCAPWAHETLGTIANGTVRLSPGFFNTSEEIAAVLQAVRTIAEGGKYK